MVTCHEMKKGEIYACKVCGLELQVIKECDDAGTPAEECGCHEDDNDPCTFLCCGSPLVKK